MAKTKGAELICSWHCQRGAVLKWTQEGFQLCHTQWLVMTRSCIRGHHPRTQTGMNCGTQTNGDRKCHTGGGEKGPQAVQSQLSLAKCAEKYVSENTGVSGALGSLEGGKGHCPGEPQPWDASQSCMGTGLGALEERPPGSLLKTGKWAEEQLLSSDFRAAQEFWRIWPTILHFSQP